MLTTSFEMFATCQVHALREPEAGNASIRCVGSAVLKVRLRRARMTFAVDVGDAGLTDVAGEDDVQSAR